MSSADIDLSYLAGLLDGEGSFLIQENGNSYAAIIHIQMNDPEVLRWVQKTFGGVFSERGARNPERNEKSYTWKLNRREEVSLLCFTLSPFLKVKKTQAAFMREFCIKFPSKGGKRGPLTQEEKQGMSEFYDLMRLLNRVGPKSYEIKKQANELLFPNKE
jgi:hypothetical protein